MGNSSHSTAQTGSTQKPIVLAPWQNAASGAVAGFISRCVIAPLDVIKIRFQLQSSPTTIEYVTKGLVGQSPSNPATVPKYRTILQSLRLIVKEEGFHASGLFKGNLSASYLYLSYGAVQFLTFHETDTFLTRTLDDKVPAQIRKFASGALAGAAATFATYPFDLLRTRFAVQSSTHQIYSGLFSAVKQIREQEGWSGFYRGCYPAILQIIPYMGIMFATQNQIKLGLQRLGESVQMNQFQRVQDFLSGGLAGIISKTMVMPFDVIRKRLQVQGPSRKAYILSKIPFYPSNQPFLSTMIHIIRSEGPLALFKGLVPSLLKTGPSSAVTFWVIGFCRNAWDSYNHRRD